MAGPQRKVTGTRLYSERIRLPFGGKPVVTVLRDEEGRYYTDHPLLNGRFASYKQIGDRIRELRNMFEFRIQQPQALVPPVMPLRSQLQPPASEKLVAGATEIASAAALKVPYFASSKNLLDTTPEESITVVPHTVPHNAIDSSPSTFPSCYNKFVAGTAESLPALQDLHGSSLDKFNDEFTTTNGFQQSASSIGSCDELTTASSGTVSHNNRLSNISIFSCEKFVAGAAEVASGKALQDKYFASSKELPDTTSLEESITAVPQIVPQKIVDSSPSTLHSSYEKSVSRVSRLDKFLDEFLISLETTTAVPKTVSHNTIDSSHSTLQSSCGNAVSGSAEAIPTQRERHVSFLNMSFDELIDEFLDSSSEETTTASPWTVPHNGFQQPASYIGSEIIIRRPSNCYQAFYIRMDRMGSFWTYPDVGGPFPSIHEADVAIINFIDELRHGARYKEEYKFSRGDSNYSYFLKGPPKKDPNSQSSKNSYDEKQYLVQAILAQYNGDNDLFGDLAHELKDLVKMHWIIEGPWWYYHFNFTTKQQADDSTSNKLFFAEASHLLGGNTFDINCCRIIETENDGDHCYGCRNNRDPMQHPKNTNACTRRRFDCPGVILSDYDDDDYYGNYDDDDDEDFDFEVEDGDGVEDDDGEDGDDKEVDHVVEDCNVGHTRPKIMLEGCV